MKYISVFFRAFRGYSKYLPERDGVPTFVLIFVKYFLPSEGGNDQGYLSQFVQFGDLYFRVLPRFPWLIKNLPERNGVPAFVLIFVKYFLPHDGWNDQGNLSQFVQFGDLFFRVLSLSVVQYISQSEREFIRISW